MRAKAFRGLAQPNPVHAQRPCAKCASRKNHFRSCLACNHDNPRLSEAV